MSNTVDVLAVMDRDAKAAADLRCADRTLSGDEYCRLLGESSAALVAVGDLIAEALRATNTLEMLMVTHGQATQHAKSGEMAGERANKLRAAIAACGVQS